MVEGCIVSASPRDQSPILKKKKNQQNPKIDAWHRIKIL
jgi:hypothetical protein